MYLVPSHQSNRLSKLYKENLDEKAILAELETLLADMRTIETKTAFLLFSDYH